MMMMHADNLLIYICIDVFNVVASLVMVVAFVLIDVFNDLRNANSNLN
jgi:hypothetical protein